MLDLQSNRDAYLIAIPMVIFMFASFFRLDQLWSSPKTKPERGRRLTDWDQNGVPICTDPVSTNLSIERRSYRSKNELHFRN